MKELKKIKKISGKKSKGIYERLLDVTLGETSIGIIGQISESPLEEFLKKKSTKGFVMEFSNKFL